MAHRLGLISKLIATVAVLLACGTSTAVGQTGSPSATTTSTSTPTSTPLPTATPTPDPGRYNGSWVDNSSGSTGAGELVITSSGPIATVQAYGVCGTKCNWGVSSATVGPYSLVVAYNLGSNTATLTLQLSGTDLKVVDVDSHFGTSTYSMHRGSSLELRAFLYASAWLNNNPNTNGIPELIISVTGTTLTVHGYGACTPTYCDWGTRTGTYTGDPFHILFDFGGGLTHSLSLRLLDSAGSSLQAVDVGSSSGTNTYTFHKSLVA